MIPLDCACVIHGDRYDWRYVDTLYAMVGRNLSVPLRFHVFTEPNRAVPNHMIKHHLQEWPEVSNTKKAWWYKMQMFDPRHGLERMMYLDLDVVISSSLDWIQRLDPTYFWAIHDWKRLWKPHWWGINSSMMVWNGQQAAKIWSKFQDLGLSQCVKRYHGDQDLISDTIDKTELRYFDHDLVQSWRWQIQDGGMDLKTRRYLRPAAGSIVMPATAVMVFHGRPKPHEVQDPIIQSLWKTT